MGCNICQPNPSGKAWHIHVHYDTNRTQRKVSRVFRFLRKKASILVGEFSIKPQPRKTYPVDAATAPAHDSHTNRSVNTITTFLSLRELRARSDTQKLWSNEGTFLHPKSSRTLIDLRCSLVDMSHWRHKLHWLLHTFVIMLYYPKIYIYMLGCFLHFLLDLRSNGKMKAFISFHTQTAREGNNFVLLLYAPSNVHRRFPTLSTVVEVRFDLAFLLQKELPTKISRCHQWTHIASLLPRLRLTPCRSFSLPLTYSASAFLLYYYNLQGKRKSIQRKTFDEDDTTYSGPNKRNLHVDPINGLSPSKEIFIYVYKVPLKHQGLFSAKTQAFHVSVSMSWYALHIDTHATTTLIALYCCMCRQAQHQNLDTCTCMRRKQPPRNRFSDPRQINLNCPQTA